MQTVTGSTAPTPVSPAKTTSPEGGAPPKVWDPFGRERYLERAHVAKPLKPPIKLPDWAKKLLGKLADLMGLAVLFGVLSLFVILFFSKEWAALVGVSSIVGGGLISVIHHLLGDNSHLLFERYRNLAKQKNWAFAIVTKDQEGRHKAFPPGYTFLRPLTLPRLGQPLPLIPVAEFWGKTDQTAVPFWMVVGSAGTYDSSRTRSTIAKNIPRKAGNEGSRGVTFTVLTAYDLDRDSGIRAQLVAEAPKMESRRDIQTESSQFNRIYNISVLEGARGGSNQSDAAGKQNLLQLLTPATQDVMLRLWEKYRAQFVFDGATVYMSGYFSIMSDEDAVILAHFDELLEAFAEAVQSFKQYVE